MKFLIKYFLFLDVDDNYGLPKVIEIDAYQPSLSIIGQDNSLDFSKSLYNYTSNQKSRANVKTSSYLTNEFCRFYKMKSLTNSLVYFSEPIRQSSKIDGMLKCTSCLFIYLYHHVHLRPDFYFIKDHLPKCFNNLHYSENLRFKSIKNSNKKIEATKIINDSFTFYWSKLRCEAISGTLDLSESEIAQRWCEKAGETTQVVMGRSNQLIEQQNGICKNNILPSANSTQSNRKSVYQQKSRNGQHKSHNFNLMLFLSIMILSLMLFSVFLLLKYSKSNRFWFLKTKLSKLSENLTTVSYKNVESKDFDAENNDGYEYDDDFEINKKEVEFEHRSSHEKYEDKNVARSSIKEKTIDRIRTLFNKQITKNGLVNVQRNRKSNSRKYSHYSYNSTESTLMPTLIKNEFEVTNHVKEDNKTSKNSSDEDSKVQSVVTYDKTKRKIKQNLIKDGTEFLTLNNEYPRNSSNKYEATNNKNVIRLSTNPFEISENMRTNAKSNETSA